MVLSGWLDERYCIARRDVFWCAVVAAALSAVGMIATDALTAGFGAYLIFAMLLITVIDSRVMLIPDALSLPAIPAGFAAAHFVEQKDVAAVFADNGVAALVAAGALLALRVIYRRVRGMEGLGLGDVKLAGAAGAWTGLEMLPLACLLATCGALAAVMIKSLTSTDKPDMKTAVPFGSFIAPAIAIIWIANIALVKFYLP